ncbi:hypothetical protein HK101_008827 [Irineochytrium annulatum]|nr:hypothetical protein HK101_008827 [Irineochytrium annulatum]
MQAPAAALAMLSDLAQTPSALRVEQLVAAAAAAGAGAVPVPTPVATSTPTLSYNPVALHPYVPPPAPSAAPATQERAAPVGQHVSGTTLHVTVGARGGARTFILPSSILLSYPDTLLARHLASQPSTGAAPSEVLLSLPSRDPALFESLILPFYDDRDTGVWGLGGLVGASGSAEVGRIEAELKFYGLPSPWDVEGTLGAVARSLQGDQHQGVELVLRDPVGWGGRCAGMLRDRIRRLDAERQRCAGMLLRLEGLLNAPRASGPKQQPSPAKRKREVVEERALAQDAEAEGAGDEEEGGADAEEARTAGRQHPLASLGANGNARRKGASPSSLTPSPTDPSPDARPGSAQPRRVSGSPDQADDSGREKSAGASGGSASANGDVVLKKGENGRYLCQVCDRSFGRKNDLKRHMNVHSSIKAFSCERCHHKFNRKDALIRHSINCGRRGSGASYSSVFRASGSDAAANGGVAEGQNGGLVGGANGEHPARLSSTDSGSDSIVGAMPMEPPAGVDGPAKKIKIMAPVGSAPSAPSPVVS